MSQEGGERSALSETTQMPTQYAADWNVPAAVSETDQVSLAGATSVKWGFGNSTEIDWAMSGGEGCEGTLAVNIDNFPGIEGPEKDKSWYL